MPLSEPGALASVSRPHREALGIGRGTGSEHAAEVQAQRGRRLQPDCLGDAIHALAGLLEHPLRGKQALVDQPLMRRGSILPEELAGERARRHRSPLRQLFDPERLCQVVLGPHKQGRESRGGVAPDGVRHELRLAAVAMRRHDQAARHRVGNPGTIVAADDVQARVDSRGAAGGSENAALVDIQPVGLRADAWIAARQAGAYRQCVVARLPSSSPVAARTNTPEQMETRRAPAAYAARSSRSRRSGGGASTCQPGITMVPAVRSTPTPCGASTRMPVWSKNAICMKSKDDSGRGPSSPDRGVTPRYITKKSPRNAGMAPSKPA